MPYGSNVGSRPLINATATPAISPVKARAARSVSGQSTSVFPIFLVVLVLLYMVYAFLEQHEKFRNAVKPENIAVNLRNILIMLATVVLGINVLKIAAAKLVVWCGDWPIVGPAVRFGAHLVGGV